MCTEDYKKACKLEKELAFFLPSGSSQKTSKENKEDDLKTRRKKLVEALDKLVQRQPVDCESFSALLTLQNQNLQNLGYLGGDDPKKYKKFAEDQNELAGAYCFHWLQRIALMKKIIDKASRSGLSHARRRRGLATAVVNLQDLLKELQNPVFDMGDISNINEKAHLQLARAYYQRGRIVRPQGFSVPGKKKVLLLQALEEIEQAASESHNVKAQICLEWLRFYPEQDLPCDCDQILEKCIETSSGYLKYIALLILAEKGDIGKYKNQLSQLIDLVDGNTKKPCFPLLQARAACLLAEHYNDSDFWEKCANFFPLIIEKLENVSFFQEDWEQTVELLKRSRDKITDWNRYCLDLWKLVNRLETLSSKGRHLRWYWSRQRDVYDLAFYAAGDDFRKKAEIADSLKNRPAFHLSQLQQMADEGDKNIKQWIEDYETISMERYSTNTQSHQNARDDKKKTRKKNTWQPLPDGWIAVHFYLAKWPEKKGYALIEKNGYALIEKNGWWVQKEFNYDTLWECYLTWQEDYARLKGEAAPTLERLCKGIGKEMHWLFDSELFPKNYPVVFIPHDFLYRLPLHIAIKEGESTLEILALKNKISYLPAWWLYRGDTSISHPRGTIGLINLGKSTEEIKNAKKMQGTFGTRQCKIDAEAKDLLERKPPFSDIDIVLQCHGKAHPVNPFKSLLKLGNVGVTVKDILEVEQKYTKCRIFLCVCESDLVPPLTQIIDEHFSISSGFLQQGVQEIIGTLWNADADYATEFAGKWISSEHFSSSQTLYAWYKDKLGQYPRRRRARVLYDIAPFRIIGAH